MKQTISTNVHKHPDAHISVGKSRIKKYGDTVYMKNKTEYEIEMYNPTQDI